MCVRPNYSTSPHSARGHCARLHGFRGCYAHLHRWRMLLDGRRGCRVPLWWLGWFPPHCARAVVLGSSHLLPFLDKPDISTGRLRGPSGGPVGAGSPGTPGLCAAGASGLAHWVLCPRRALDHNPRLSRWAPWPDTCVSTVDNEEDSIIVPWCANKCGGAHWKGQPAPQVSKHGGQRVSERVGDAFYPTWRAGSKFWRLAQNKAYDAVLTVQVLPGTPQAVLHPKFWFLATSPNFADLFGPSPTRGGGGVPWVGWGGRGHPGVGC